MTRIIRYLFRRYVTINTYRVAKRDWQALKEEKHRQLARELGMEWKG
ncbi:hypothetical protein [Oricola thermophila]|uniref:Uncharacterized protein n=1 Tax=Oricola thermophila TaxID=2742145 RepID=A0A6N1VF88_9HYPH|nr:hypothetical protein [Oricola thermophila]QKV17819.1 hypothetical protein HTY61_04780 [Oricola thermophila]